MKQSASTINRAPNKGKKKNKKSAGQRKRHTANLKLGVKAAGETWYSAEEWRKLRDLEEYSQKHFPNPDALQIADQLRNFCEYCATIGNFQGCLACPSSSLKEREELSRDFGLDRPRSTAYCVGHDRDNYCPKCPKLREWEHKKELVHRFIDSVPKPSSIPKEQYERENHIKRGILHLMYGSYPKSSFEKIKPPAYF